MEHYHSRTGERRMDHATGARGRGRALLVSLAAAAMLSAGAADVAGQRLVASNGGAPTGEVAAPGRILGRVVSEQTGEPIAGAEVRLTEGQRAALTNMDGRYLIQDVQPGTHAVVVQVIGYARKTVTGVEIDPGETRLLDVSLSTEAVSLGAITVSADIEKGSTTALLSERRRSAVVVDAIGAEQIAMSADGNAAAVLARAPGVSIVDDRYVYVRGLGERYGSATLNGTPLASPEPDRKTVPLDLIPASFLESVVTAKTYSPDQPGDYAGGLVQIRTRNFPTQRIAKLGVSTGYNAASTFASGLTAGGGAYDFLAFDDGSRALPADLPARRITTSNFSTAELEQLGEQFLGTWGPRRASSLPMDRGFSVAVGDELRFLDDEVPVGYLLALTQSTSTSNRDGLTERVLGGGDDFEVDYTGTTTTRSATIGGMLNLSVEPAPTHRLSASALYNRNADDEARVLQGYNHDFSTNQRNHRIRYLAQELFAAQLKGEHEIGLLNDTRVAWRADLSRAGRYEPNTREVLYRQAPDGRFLFETFVQSGSVFHSDLDETGYGAGLDVDVPFAVGAVPATLSFGASADWKERDAYARRFRFLPVGSLPEEVREREPNELFDETTIDPAMFRLTEGTFEGDNYLADQTIRAAYALLDAEILPRVRLVGGARVEQSEQRVDPLDRFTQTAQSLPDAWLSDIDILPGVNLAYEATPSMTLRAALSRTLARPQFRELAPFKFTDYVGGFLTIGNPALERSTIDNYDLRWEWYPELGSLVAVSGFYKRFTDPIESVVLTSTELMQTWVNAESAENYGVELELRTTLGFLHEGLRSWAVNGNLTWVASEVSEGGTVEVFLPFGTGVTELSRTDRNRPLQGQSPYTANLGVTWAREAWGTNLAVLYNRFGRRIDTVGDTQLPDIMEEARGQLDFVLEQSFGRGVTAKLSAKRVLGSDVEFTQGGHVVRTYDLGRVLSLSLSWGLGG